MGIQRVDKLRLTSCMAPLMDPMVADLAAYLEVKTGVRFELFAERDWHVRNEHLDRGQVELAWLYGLPYAWRADREEPYRLLAAPVMAGDRYAGLPVYYSEIVVPVDSGMKSIVDLQGGRWAYNEPASHSGYNVARLWLARNGLGWDHFEAVYEAGTHERALGWVRSGRVDGAAIDTTVLDWELRREPELADRIRTIDVLGPSPIPPWTVHDRVPGELQRALRGALLDMRGDPEGQQLLGRHGLHGFAAVMDCDYDPIRHWDRRARTVGSPDPKNGPPAAWGGVER